MKRWVKYAAVVCSFLIMIGVFLPDSGNRVNASEAGTVSGSDSGERTVSGSDSGVRTITVSYKLNGGTKWLDSDGKEMSSETSETIPLTQEIPPGSGGIYEISLLPYEPGRDNYTFAGWLCEVSNITYEIGTGPYSKSSSITINDATKVAEGATITFTAQWTEVPKVPENNVISEGGSYVLTAEEEYTLGDGTWTVSGDSSTTYKGGIKFYVDSTGTYTFTK